MCAIGVGETVVSTFLWLMYRSTFRAGDTGVVANSGSANGAADA